MRKGVGGLWPPKSWKSVKKLFFFFFFFPEDAESQSWLFVAPPPVGVAHVSDGQGWPHYSTFESYISVSNLIKKSGQFWKISQSWEVGGIFYTNWEEFWNKFNFHVVSWCVSIYKLCRMYTWGNVCAQQLYILYKNFDTPG